MTRAVTEAFAALGMYAVLIVGVFLVVLVVGRLHQWVESLTAVPPEPPGHSALAYRTVVSYHLDLWTRRIHAESEAEAWAQLVGPRARVPRSGQ